MNGEETINMAGVPKRFQPIFLKAQEYVRRYFQKRVENTNQGTLEIAGERYVLVRAASMSVEFFDLITSLYKDQGEEEAKNIARGLLFDISHARGRADAREFHAKMNIKDPKKRLSAVPFHMAHSGWGVFDILAESNLTRDENYLLVYDHPLSFEAEEWLKNSRKTDFPVCIMNAGYPSGWCEESFGISLVAVEIECRAKGDEHCRFIMAPPSKIEEYIARFSTRARRGRKRPKTLPIPRSYNQKRLEDEPRKAHEEIERRVEERTAELVKTNEQMKREIERLKEEERLFETLLSSTPACLYIVQDGRIQFVNPQFLMLTGYKEDELLGRDSCGLILPEDINMVRENALKRLKGELSSPFEFRALTKGGEIRWVEETITSIQYQGRRAILGYFTDMTERKQAEKEKDQLQALLQQAQKMEAIGTLAGGIAHDFNNLLMGIQGNASLMLLDVDPTHPHYTKLKSIEQQIESGSRLTTQLLGYARKGRYEVRPINLNKLVEQTSETFGRTKREIAIHRELAEDLSAIEADAGQIEQVLLNFYINAADAMPNGGKLILKTMNVTHENMKGRQYDPKPGNYVSLIVTDTGIGMNKKTMERIFDPFFTTKEMGRKGTGLGMASAYGIVKAHGGYIDVESKKGHGSTFKVYFPALEEAMDKEFKATEQPSKGEGTILLVDDEKMVIQVGRDMLEVLGYEVLIARSGKEAIELYKEKKERISIVILDMIMPDMGGGETYDILKSINKDIKVLLTSGYNLEGKAKEILERGCDGFLQKPFSIKELARTTKDTLNKR